MSKKHGEEGSRLDPSLLASSCTALRSLEEVLRSIFMQPPSSVPDHHDQQEAGGARQGGPTPPPGSGDGIQRVPGAEATSAALEIGPHASCGATTSASLSPPGLVGADSVAPADIGAPPPTPEVDPSVLDLVLGEAAPHLWRIVGSVPVALGQAGWSEAGSLAWTCAELIVPMASGRPSVTGPLIKGGRRIGGCGRCGLNPR